MRLSAAPKAQTTELLVDISRALFVPATVSLLLQRSIVTRGAKIISEGNKLKLAPS